jgi:hypothetical protein
VAAAGIKARLPVLKMKLETIAVEFDFVQPAVTARRRAFGR